MESLSGASSSSSVEFVLFDDFDFEFVDEVERLSNWEFLDASDAEMDGSGDGEGVDSSVDGRVPADLRERLSPVAAVPISLAEDRIDDRVGVYLLQDLEDGFAYGYDGNRCDYEGAEEDEADDDGDEYDLDDELVPWSVSGKLGRQRMRKLGKRGFTRMYNSKRSPFLFTKPGCVRGKHGLGLKHSY